MGTPYGSYGGYRQGFEFQTLLKAGGMTGFHGEAFVSFNDCCYAQHLPRPTPTGRRRDRPVRPDRRSSYVHFTRGAGAQKALALAAHGIRYINWYTYGPSRLTTGDGLAGRGATSMESLADPAGRQPRAGDRRTRHRRDGPRHWPGGTSPRATRCGGTPSTIGGYTSPISGDEIGTYLALTHMAPARFPWWRSAFPKIQSSTPRRCCSSAGTSPQAAFAAIEGRVAAGKVAAVIGQLPALDELAQPAPERLDFLGTDDQPLDIWTPTYTVTFGDGTAVMTAYRRPVAGGTVLATYDDGGAAVVEVARGAGRVRTVGFVLGRAYIDFAEPCLVELAAEASVAFSGLQAVGA